jgi:hypothetical protein
VTLVLEIQGPATALVDEPFAFRVRGAGPGADVVWHARMRDDDGLVWRARAARAEDLPGAWRGKAQRAGVASLRPLQVELRVEAADGRAATRTVTRTLVAEGVRIRRWRDGLIATLHLPAGEPLSSVLVDGAAIPAAALLASRGVLVLALAQGDQAAARERLAAVPGAGEVETLAAGDVPIPPGLPGGDAAAWAELVRELRARRR